MRFPQVTRILGECCLRGFALRLLIYDKIPHLGVYSVRVHYSISRALLSMVWSCDLSSPANQRRNGFIESFNGRFRDECLNEHWFSDIVHAGKIIVTGDWIITSVDHIQH